MELLLGAILGVVVTEVYEKIIIKILKHLVKTRLLKIAHNLYNNKNTINYLMKYYEDNGSYSDLYDCEIQNFSKKILFLTNEKWCNLKIDIYNNPSIIKHIDSDNLQFVENKMIVKKRKFIGQKIFNNKCLYLSKINTNGEIEAKECNFYQKLTLVDKLENETYALSMGLPFVKPKLRNRMLQNFTIASTNNNLPISLGCHVLLALKTAHNISIILEKRSEKTFTYGGYYASIPVFGLVPIPSTNSLNGNNNNVLLYNIIKEYCEELFNRDDLEQTDKHMNPFWFYEEYEEAKNLFKSIQEGTTLCTFVGYGFDVINGLSTLGVLLYITDENLSKSIINQCKANWEVDDDIKILDINDPNLKEFLTNNKMQNSTAFTLSNAINYLKNIKEI